MAGGGLPSFPQSTFPKDKPPTLFSPASPRVKPTKPDTASVKSTSTFSSTVGLIKSKLPISYKDYKAQKESKAAKKTLTDMVEEKSPRASLTETFAIMAETKR